MPVNDANDGLFSRFHLRIQKPEGDVFGFVTEPFLLLIIRPGFDIVRGVEQGRLQEVDQVRACGFRRFGDWDIEVVAGSRTSC